MAKEVAEFSGSWAVESMMQVIIVYHRIKRPSVLIICFFTGNLPERANLNVTIKNKTGR